MSFDPASHIIKLPRRVKDKDSGQMITVYDDYLEVKWRLCWFRDLFPHGQIETEEVEVHLDRVVNVDTWEWVKGKREKMTKSGMGYARFKARITDGEGGVATGYGTENAAEFGDFVERAETRAIGRALARLGIGTEFIGQEESEGDHIVDAPVIIGHGHEHGPASTEHGSVPAKGVTGANDTQKVPAAKLTGEEVSQLLGFLLEIYKDAGLVHQHVRAALGIPANQECSDFRIRTAMTRPHATRLEEDAAAYALRADALVTAFADADDDVPSFDGTEASTSPFVAGTTRSPTDSSVTTFTGTPAPTRVDDGPPRSTDERPESVSVEPGPAYAAADHAGELHTETSDVAASTENHDTSESNLEASRPSDEDTAPSAGVDTRLPKASRLHTLKQLQEGRRTR